MDGLSSDPNEALVFHCNRNSQDKLSGSACIENEPLDVSSIISSDGAGKETGNSAVEKVEFWSNGVKRVIFVPLGNNSTEPRSPSEPSNRTEHRSPNEVRGSFAATDPNPPSPVIADSSSYSRTESYSRLTVASCTGENTVLSKSVSTNTVDQLPNRCVATVAPQINRELGRLLVSSAVDIVAASKSRESSYRQAASLIKQEKPPASSTNCLNVGRESVEALPFGANVSHHQQQQPFVHQMQHPLSEHQRLLNLNEYHYHDRQSHLQRLGYDEFGRLPITNTLTRNTLPPRAGPYANASDGGYARYALPTADSFAGHHRLPMQMAPYLLNPLHATVLASNGLGPGGIIPGRVESNHFSSLLGMSDPTVGSNRSAQIPMPVPNATALLGNPAVMVPLQRYRHLLATLDSTRHPYTYGRFVPPDGAQLHNVYAPLARFPTRGDFPHPQFPARLSSNEQAAAQVVRGDFLHPQFPVRPPPPPPINDKVVPPPVTSFNNGYRFLGHHPNYASSFLHAQNQARHEPHIPSSISSFNDQHSSKIFLSEASQHLQNVGFGQPTHSVGIGQHLQNVGIGQHLQSVSIGQHLQSVGIGQPTHTPLNFKQPETVPGGSLTTAQRVHQNQSRVSPAVSEMPQMHLLPPSSLHYGNLRGCEQSILRMPNVLGFGLPSDAASQPFRSSPGLAHRETTKSSTFQPMARNLSNNAASPQDMQQFMRAPYKSTALSQDAVSSSPQTGSPSQCVTVPGLRGVADEQNGLYSLAGAWYSSPSNMAAFSQNLFTQSFLSASPGVVPCGPVSHNRFSGYWPRLFSPGAQTHLSLQAPPLSSTSRSQSDAEAETPDATGLQSRLSNVCSSTQADDTFRNSYGNCMETGNRTILVLNTSGSSQPPQDPQSSISAGSAVSTVLTSTNKGGDKSVDNVILTNSNNEYSKSADVAVKDRILPLRSTDTVLDASHETLPERAASPPLQRQPEPGGTELQGPPQSPAVSQPGSPQSPMSEIMNSIDKISDDLSMQKWLDSLIGNISDSDKDGCESPAKSKTADSPVVSQASTKDTTTGAGGGAPVCAPSMAKQVDYKKTKRTWIGIKSIEAEMSPKSSDVKAKRRKRRRLTLKSNQSPEGSCDASSDSWHPDSFASSESSVDSHLTSIPSTPDSESSWLSNDSVTMGKRRKKRSRKSASSKHRAVHESRRRRRARRSHNLSPWCRTRPCSGGIRGCFVSLEVLRLQAGVTSVNVTRASELLCCSSKTKGRADRRGSETEESYGSWCPFKRKKHFLKRGSKRRRNTVRSGSETEDSSSRSSRQRSKKRRYSKPARNVVLSGSDTE